MALPAQVGGFFLQKILERFDPGQQTEVLKAALNLLEFTASRSSVTEPSAITEAVSRIVFVTGVAPLCAFSTPSLPAQGSSAHPQICNICRDIPAEKMKRSLHHVSRQPFPNLIRI
jgi:hypothetical protein